MRDLWTRRLLAVVLLLAAFLLAFAPKWAVGFENGRAPRSALVHVVTPHGCYFLSKKAGAAYNTMQLAAGRHLYVNGCDSAYRSLARQVYYRASWCALGHCENAAVPGTSNHGLGLAVDIPPSTRAVVDGIGVAYGWCKRYHPMPRGPPCGPSDASFEPWHYRWTAGIWHRHPNPGTSLQSPTLRVGSGGPGQARFVQKVQRQLGFRHLTGRYQDATAHAVGRFQRLKKLRSTGIVNGATWQALRHKLGRIAPATIQPRLLEVHTPRLHGADVLAFEQSLNARLHELRRPLCPANGVYTRRVARCVRFFQHARHLTADGVVGPVTWEAVRTRAPPARKPKPPPVDAPVVRHVAGHVIDVSENDGSSIDWLKVARRNSVQGVWLKATEGQDFTDSTTTPARLVAIRNAGLPYGFYHFMRPRLRDPCSTEIPFFIRRAKALGGWGTIRPALDVEVTALSGAATGRYVARAERCFHHQAGFWPEVYVGWYRWRDEYARFPIPGCHIWLPAYLPRPPPTPGRGCKHWEAWQYTSTARIAGIPGSPVDVSYVPNLSKIRLPTH